MNDRGSLQDINYIGMIKIIEDGSPIKGIVASIKHYVPDDNGELERDGKRYTLKEEKSTHNTLCNLGNALAALRFKSAVETQLATHMAVGTTSGGKTSASTTLEVEIGRVALDSLTSPVQGAANDNVVTAVATFPAGTGTGALVEAGLLTAAANGILICYAEFGVVTKAAADIVIFTWTLTFGTT